MPTEPASRVARARALLRSTTAGQAATFTVSSAAISGLSAVSAVILARNMSTEEFGVYSFALAAVLFLAMFYEFGLFLPAARMAAEQDEAGGRPLTAATLLMYLPIGILFSVTIWAASFAVEPWFDVSAGPAMLLTAPVAFVFPFEFIALQLSQGLGRLAAYAAAAVGGRGLYVVVLAVIYLAGSELSAAQALALFGVCMLAGWGLLLARLKPQRSGAASHLPSLFVAAREYGFQVYVGRVLSIGTYNMDTLLVAAFADARSVAYYRLATTLSSVISLPAMGLSSVLFRRMVGEDRIDRRVLSYTGGLSVGIAVVVALAANPLVGIVFSDRYLPAAAMLVPLAFAAAVRGITTIYNTYLSAHAAGRELRNAALVLTVSNVALGVLLIPRYGAHGAAWASLLALLANLAAHMAGYSKAQRAQVVVA